jgi:hypothetical protein
LILGQNSQPRQSEIADDLNSEDADAFPAIGILVIPSPRRRRKGGEWNDFSGTPRRRAKRRGLGTCKCFSLSAIIKAPGGHLGTPSNEFKMHQRRQKMSGIFPEDSGKLKYRKSERMDDVATANFLIEEIGARRHIGEMFRTACRELRARFPHRDDPENQWTERRLRGWWNNESRVVKHFQMVELYETAEALRKAREEHAEYKAKTERLRQMAQLRKAGIDRNLAER